MRFRPCIDIHNGRVKQIVGGSISDINDQAVENFVAHEDASFFANKYRQDGLSGGHIILLNHATSEYYDKTKEQALAALSEYPEGMQVGGGINPSNATEFLSAGASHVIVTSYVFADGKISFDNLKEMVAAVGKEQLVLDLSCRKKDDKYVIVTDRWQKFTDVIVSAKVLEELAAYCNEFLVHAVDVEGKSAGIETELVEILAEYEGIPITYAGGIGKLADLKKIQEIGKGKVDATIGSALDLFGGDISYDEVLKMYGIS